MSMYHVGKLVRVRSVFVTRFVRFRVLKFLDTIFNKFLYLYLSTLYSKKLPSKPKPNAALYQRNLKRPKSLLRDFQNYLLHGIPK